MKTITRSLSFTPAAILLGLVLFVNTPASAELYFLAVNQSGSGDWTQPIWTNATHTVPVAATSGNDYQVGTFAGSFGAVRTINTAVNPQSFAGDHLILTNGGVLYLKNAGAACTANVIVDGGQIIFHGSGGAGVQLGGAVQVNLNDNTLGGPGGTTGSAFYNLGQDQGNATDKRNILLQANVSGNGNLVVNMGVIAAGSLNTVQISGTNSAFTGNWTNNQGTLEIESSSVNPLGSGAVVLNFANNTFLNFNTTNNLVIANSISGAGAVGQINAGTVTLNGNNSYTGATTISNGVLRIGASSSITNSAVISLKGGTLDASLIGGLVLTSNQQMNCNGSIISNLTASSSATLTNILNFNLTPATNDILNVSGSLTLVGTPNITLTLNGSKPNGTYRLINYSGTIQGGGSFAVTPPVGSNEGFALNTNTPGQVNLVVTGAVVHNLNWVGGVSADWDSSTANWAGDATVYASGDNVTFNDTGSAASPINFVSDVAPGSITVSNTAKQYIFGAYSGPTQPGIVTSGSLTKKGANELIFATTGNNISGPIDIQAGTLTIGTDGNTGSLGTGPITNNGILQVSLDGGAVAFNAPISGTGSLVVMNSFASSTATVTIGGNGHNSYTGLTTIGNQCQLNIATSNALGSTSSGTIVLSGGRLGVTSTVGTMTVAEPVTLSGPGLSGLPFGALYVGDPANNVTWAGPITVVGGNATIRGVNNSRMNFSNTVLGNDVALTCDAGNPGNIGGSDASTTIFFQNTVSLGNGGSMTLAGVGTVILDGATNVWGGGTTVNLGTLRVGGVLNGGNVTIGDGVNFATLTGTGTILNPVTVASGSLLFPGSFSAPIGTLTVSNSVTLSSGSTNLFELDRSLSPNSSRLVANSISRGGTLRVVNIGVPLQADDTFTLFSSSSLSGSFSATSLPALSPPLSWDTSLLQSQGIIKVASTVPPTPVITVPAVSGANFTLQVAASASGFNYVLQATPALAPSTWASIQTNAGTGSTLNFTNMITPGTPQQFFRIIAQ